MRGSSSSDAYAEHATPKSTPHPGLAFFEAGCLSVATPKATYHDPACLVKVALQISPPGLRDQRKRCQPIFGSRTSPQCLEMRRSSIAWPGKLNLSVEERFSKVGARAGCSGSHQLSYAASSWRRTCWPACAGKSRIQSISALASVRAELCSSR
ncbi:MAG: hypothetical protein M1522_03070, partial [Actinobacteria bacterium]|nr:hypothetical protein [Actinomycetota bacterium]